MSAIPPPQGTDFPTSYLPQAEREALMREGGMNLVYIAESQEAGNADDMDAAWAWMALAELPAHSLMRLKKSQGAQFIRDMGFNTSKADMAYGAGWLDRD